MTYTFVPLSQLNPFPVNTRREFFQRLRLMFHVHVRVPPCTTGTGTRVHWYMYVQLLLCVVFSVVLHCMHRRHMHHLIVQRVDFIGLCNLLRSLQGEISQVHSPLTSHAGNFQIFFFFFLSCFVIVFCAWVTYLR